MKNLSFEQNELFYFSFSTGEFFFFLKRKSVKKALPKKRFYS